MKMAAATAAAATTPTAAATPTHVFHAPPASS
jgi:hypothetical protein